MTATVKIQISFESLVEAIESLNLEAKLKLREILDEQIFEAEEDLMENDPAVLAEVEAARKAYQAGDYQTLEEYIANRSSKSP